MVVNRIVGFLGQDPSITLSSDQAPKKSRGFRTPYTTSEADGGPSGSSGGGGGSGVGSIHGETLDTLYRFYAHANSELYRLMARLGPETGWAGSFPASREDHDARRRRHLLQGGGMTYE